MEFQTKTLKWEGDGVWVVITKDLEHDFDEAVRIGTRGRVFSRGIERRHVNVSSVSNALYDFGRMSADRADALAALIVEAAR